MEFASRFSSGCTTISRVSPMYGKLDLLETRHGTNRQPCLDRAWDCWCTKVTPRGNTRVVIWKFEIGSFVQCLRKSVARQPCEMKTIAFIALSWDNVRPRFSTEYWNVIVGYIAKSKTYVEIEALIIFSYEKPWIQRSKCKFVDVLELENDSAIRARKFESEQFFNEHAACNF